MRRPRMVVTCICLATCPALLLVGVGSAGATTHGIPKLTKLWNKRLIGPGTAPVVDNGMVFVTATTPKAYVTRGSSGVVYAMDALCSPAPARCPKHLAWSHGYTSFTGVVIPIGAAGTGNGDVYVGVPEYGAGGNVGGPEQALTETTGSPVFSGGVSGSTTAIEGGGLVYVTWAEEVLGETAYTGTEALDAGTGAVRFTTTIGWTSLVYPYSSSTGPTTAPTLGDGSVFVGYGSSLDAFDASGATGCAPTPPDLEAFVGLTPQCSALWSGVTGGTLTGTPVVAGGEVLVGASDGVLYAFPEAGCGSATCPPDWTAMVGGSLTTTAVADATTVLVTSSNGMLDAFPVGGCGAGICAPLWTANVGGTPTGPAQANDLVYVGSSDGLLQVFHASGCGHPTCGAAWKANVRKPLANAPAVGTGIVFVTDTAHALVAYRTP